METVTNRFVSRVWTDHNDSAAIRSALDRCLASLAPGELGLNVGSGSRRLHAALVSLDLHRIAGIDVCADAQCLPFKDEAFHFVMSQEVLEHLADPFQAMREMGRVLRKGGTLYCQAPFVIGYHPGPSDFWRFTTQGIRQIVEHAGLRCDEVRIAVGPGTAFYRVAVEFVASSLARIAPRVYRPTKAVLALLFFPLKWLDPLLNSGRHADRIAGGYFVIAKR